MINTMTYIFNGECPAGIKQAFIDTYLPKLELVVETTADYKKSGIYSATRDDTSKPVVIDWGDGTIEQVDWDISQKVHEYAIVGTFNVVIKNIKSYAASANNYSWHHTTSQNAYTLKEVVAIPNSVTSIKSGAFLNCTSLTNVTIPNSVTSIQNFAFDCCSGLMSFTVSDGNVNYKSVNDLLLSKDGKTLIVGINGDVTIPDGVISIQNNAFYCYSGLTNVTIPDSVTSIQNNVFYGCSRLTSVAFEGKTLAEVQAMSSYPWGITNTSIITVI